MISNSNVFIEFELIKISPINDLRDELDTIIQLQNRIYIWSNIYSPEEMRLYCLQTKVNLKEEEQKLHLECFKLRNKELLSYDEIGTKLNISPKRIGFFAKVNPKKQWTLDDWIIDYYKKDSSIYSKVDFIIDPQQKIVDRFARIGIKGNVIKKL